ncbi:hypothetical protein [Micromonospora inyonensis]|uniref:Endonuclease NucS n=1 Tax=Micromonospora inyonensis TaxID=47866 RepID=A0A1C6SHN6_9ACTN|nr:hypothetical protein [Micromonospora inyonensis]SCL28991.1 hypothetical protein GA0074694_5266 [Micromonospora inyonensis]
MPLYEIDGDHLRRHDAARFAALGLYERKDLQRLLRDDIAVLSPDLLVVAEEFGNWEDSRRRIDLLAIDKAGHLVVIELKRTDDGGHMELQALRYAAMVSAMSFDEVVAAYEAHLVRTRPDDEVDARAELLGWLDVGDNDDTPIVSSDVRIILVSADFGRELTTAVLWLNRFEGMDVRCVRLIPYQIDGRILLDIQQVIPLPEAADYQIRVGRKATEQERRGSDNRDWTRYHIVIDGQPLPDQNKRQAVRLMIESLVAREVPAAAIGKVLTPGRFRPLRGEHHTDEEVQAALAEQYPDVDVRRWFTDHALVENGTTWVVRRIWGRNTEPMLTALRDAFPDARVGFQRAST